MEPILLILITVGLLLTTYLILTSEEIMQSGDLVVNGSGKTSILLTHFHESKVRIHFTGDQEHIPCNYEARDSFEWKIVENKKFKFKKQYFLIISWKVSNMRNIRWEIR